MSHDVSTSYPLDSGRVLLRDVKVLETYQAKSKDMEVLSKSQDGGMVTTLAIKALERGLVDAVVLAGTEDKWLPKPVLALKPEEVLRCSKSKYFYIPSIIELGRFDYVKRVMVVGLPCQIRAITRLAEFDVDIARRVIYKIGLFCAHNVDYSSMVDKLLPKAGIDVNSLAKMDTKRRLIFYDKSGKSYELPLSEFETLTRPLCLQCPEFVSRLADINVGFMGASEGWNMVLLMTKQGEELFSQLLENFEWKKPTSEDLDRVYKMDRRKKESVANYFKNFYGVGPGTRLLDYNTWRALCR
jgi:coenzyme F420 hydrogenase subunit beta